MDAVFLSQIMSVTVAILVVMVMPVFFLLKRIGLPRGGIPLSAVPVIGMIVVLWRITSLPWPAAETDLEAT